MDNIFTSWHEDPVGIVLSTGYLRFTSAFEIDGLAKTFGPRLDILALESKKPGQGNCRAFLAACKTQFDTICVWSIFNTGLEQALMRYGFKPTQEIIFYGKNYSEQIEGYRWDKT